jgi:CheY-like chemotaxis protein
MTWDGAGNASNAGRARHPLAHFKRNAAVMPRTRSGRDNHAMGISHRVLVLDSDALTQSMISEWLDADGWQVLEPAADPPPGDLGLVVVDLPFPRAGSLDPLQQVRQEYPDVPVLVISSTVFGNVGCFGPCAQALGVSGVLPKPVSREALIGAARRLARPACERAPQS